MKQHGNWASTASMARYIRNTNRFQRQTAELVAGPKVITYYPSPFHSNLSIEQQESDTESGTKITNEVAGLALENQGVEKNCQLAPLPLQIHDTTVALPSVPSSLSSLHPVVSGQTAMGSGSLAQVFAGCEFKGDVHVHAHRG